MLPHEREARGGVAVVLDDDMLQEIAEAGFCGALVAALDLEIIGNGTLLVDLAVGPHQNHPSRVTESRAARLELFERRQPGAEAGELLLAHADAPRTLLVVDARARQLRLTLGTLDLDRLERVLRGHQGTGRRNAIDFDPLRLDAHISQLDVELGQRLADTVLLRGRVVHSVPQGGRRVDHGEDLAASGLHVRIQSLDLTLRRAVRLVGLGQHGRRLVARPLGLGRGGLARFDEKARRRPPRTEIADFSLDVPGARGQRLSVLAVEFELLLAAVDIELASVRLLAHGRRAAVGLRLLDPKPAERRFGGGQSGGRGGFALARLRQTRAGSLDVCSQLAVPLREEDFLPAAQLVAQPLVPPRLRRLPLQRAPLLVQLEDDVVDTKQVLLRRLELQLGGAAARPVLGDARRLVDELTPIGRAGAENHADLALLDDRVGLCAETRVHQQLVDIPQPAHLSVNQVFALTGPVEAPRHLDVACERLDHLREMAVAVTVPVAVAVPVALGVMMPVAVAVGGRELHQARRLGCTERIARSFRRRREAGQAQADFGGGAGSPGVAAIEDDVLHPVAAQALGALLSEHPRDRIGDVALAAPVRSDDGSDALVEGELSAIGERFETGDFEAFETHSHPRPRLQL